MEGTIARPCNAKRAGYMACMGYLSVSEAWRAGMRYAAKKAEGKRLVLLHLGDHDPSGIDMTRDNRERLEFFAREHGIEVRRLALNMDQVEKYSPPPQFAKQTDSRFDGYAAQYGTESWELDALRQSVIGELITSALDSLIDKDKWAASMVKEQELRASTRVAELAKRWDEVHKLLFDDGFPMDRLSAIEECLNLHDVADVLKAGAVVTDVGSTGWSSLHKRQDIEHTLVSSLLVSLGEIAAKAEEVAFERADGRVVSTDERPEVDRVDEEDESYADDEGYDE